MDARRTVSRRAGFSALHRVLCGDAVEEAACLSCGAGVGVGELFARGVCCVWLAASDRGQEMDFAIFLDSLEHSYGADFSVYGDGYVWFEFEAVDEAGFHARVRVVEVVDHFADGFALYWDGGLAVREFLHQWGDENRWHLMLPRRDSPGLPRRLGLYYSVSSGRAHG